MGTTFENALGNADQVAQLTGALPSKKESIELSPFRARSPPSYAGSGKVIDTKESLHIITNIPLDLRISKKA